MDFDILNDGADNDIGKVRPEAGELLCTLFSQTQLLAALCCLNKLQIFPCIPPSEAVPLHDVAEMTGVPEHELAPIIRLVATAGFICEPKPGLVAHTRLSEQFLRKPALLDAVSFIGDTALPVVLQMANVNRLPTWASESDQRSSAYNSVTQSSSTFATDCYHQPKLRRQATAFQRLVLQHALTNDHNIVDVVTRLVDFPSLGRATIAQVGCQSDAVARDLVRANPHLYFVVQMTAPNNLMEKCSMQAVGKNQNDSSDRVTIQYCTSGTPPLVSDAHVYIVHLPSPSILSSSAEVLSQKTAILQAHFDVLRLNKQTRLILIIQGPHGASAVGDRPEVTARTHELLLMQLTGECKGGSHNHIDQLLCRIKDGKGRLVALRQEVSAAHPTVAVEVGIGAL